MTRLFTTTLGVLLLMFAAPVLAQDGDVSEPPDTDTSIPPGQSTVTLDERSPLSTVEAISTRFRVELKDPPADYNLADESFVLYVPQEYDGSEPYGLIVWISPNPNGWPLRRYMPTLDKHRFIWIGANNSGNPRSFWHRAGLALDGLHHVNKAFNIDPMRTYISGLSGGGRCSSRIGLTYADLFAGAYPIIGVDYFKKLPHPESTERRLLFWDRRFNPPSPDIMRRAKRDGRYVLLTGEYDGNRLQTLITYEYGFKRARFAYATYLEVPGMEHTYPPADWFEKGIIALDTPLAEVRERRETQAERALDRAMDRLQRSPPHGIEALEELLKDYNDTTHAHTAAEYLKQVKEDPNAFVINKPVTETPEDKPKPTPANRAREDLALATNYLRAGRTNLASDLLNKIVEYYPDTDEAEQARALLEGMTAQ